MFNAMLLCLACIPIGARDAAAGQAEPRVRTYPVAMAVTADKPNKDGCRTVRVTLSIAKEHHIYANPVGNKYLGDGETRLKIVAKQRLRAVKITYPKGKAVEDHLIEKYAVYRGKVVLQALVQQAAGDTGHLEVQVWVHPADYSKCYVPRTLKTTIP